MIHNCLPLSITLPKISVYLLSTWLLFASPITHAAKMVLIIDDVGERHNDDVVLSLPTAVTFSILPFSKNGRRLAEAAYAQQRELMLHLPMATINNKDPGPLAITPELDKPEVQRRVQKALAKVPFITGVNNHMGSAVTPDRERMGWVMEVLSQQPLFFVDSLTIHTSTAYEQAKAYGMPSLKRQVFLDPSADPKVIEQQWQRALAIAKRHQHVVVIAHPYPNTIAFLQRQLPLNEVELISVASLLQLQQQAAL